MILIAVQAAFFVVTAAGFVFAFRGLRQSKTVAADAVTDLQDNVRQLEAKLEAAELTIGRLQNQTRQVEEQASLMSGTQAKSWTNINRRSQAIRMLKSGSTPDRVAAELSLTRGEVELIRKVERLTNDFYRPAPEFNHVKENYISALRG
jgi:hypothetical protein